MRLIGLTGWSGAGKTTLLARLLPVLIARGHRVSTLKHAHHDFDIDQPGKDSHTHRLAGATEVLVSSSRRWALIHELRAAPEPSLHDLLRQMSPVDFVLIEGFKSGDHPKFEVFRASLGKRLLQPEDASIVAVVTDDPLDLPVTRFGFAALDGIATLIEERAVPIVRC